MATMPAFNSCTKCVGILGIKHDRTSNCHLVSWAHVPDLTTYRTFDCQATWIIDMFGISVDVIYGCLYNQALVDVRSTGSEIKCLYCNTENIFIYV